MLYELGFHARWNENLCGDVGGLSVVAGDGGEMDLGVARGRGERRLWQLDQRKSLFSVAGESVGGGVCPWTEIRKGSKDRR